MTSTASIAVPSAAWGGVVVGGVIGSRLRAGKGYGIIPARRAA